MILVDFIIGNRDRHWKNFGLLRDSRTCEYVKSMPLYDMGTSLWCWGDGYGVINPRGVIGKGAFKDTLYEQLRLVSDYSWYDGKKLDGIERHYFDLLCMNRHITREGAEKLSGGLKGRVEYLDVLINEKHGMVNGGNEGFGCLRKRGTREMTGTELDKAERIWMY